MDIIRFDLFAIGISTFLYVVIHFTWYSKWLFGSYCMPQTKENFFLRGVAKTLVLGIIVSYFLSFFVGFLNVTTVSDGMFVAICAWLGFVFTTALSSIVYPRTQIRLLLIDMGASLLSYIVMGGIIGA